MARRRNREPWWHAYRDRGMRDGLPFTFMQREHLVALGVAIPSDDDDDDDVVMLDRDALKAWSPPPAATDTFVLEARRGAIHKSATGTRLDPVAAQILWTARAELEPKGLVTASAWCTSCGRHFLDRRAGYVARIARWCQTCPRRSRAVPPLRKCAASDCERWFGPTRQNQIFHSNACRKAAQAPRPLMP